MKYSLTKIKKRIKRFFREFYSIPYCVPAWGLAEHLTAFHCLITGNVIVGNHRARLYEQVKNKTGKSSVFGYNSGREAIWAALKAGNICDGDKVIMPSYCCETVAQAILASGANPVFCDIGEDYNPNVDHILELIDPTVKSIIFPHMFGNPGRIDILEDELVKRNIRSDILLIDDAAQSFGARLHGKLVGTFGDVGIISFGPGKTMTATGGGLLITDAAALANRAKSQHIHSFPLGRKLKKTAYWFVFRRWRKYTLPFYPFLKFLFRHTQGDADILYSMCNIDAAIGLKQLKQLEGMIRKRIDRKKILDDLFSQFSSVLYCLPDNCKRDVILNVATKYPVHFTKRSDNIQIVYQKYMQDRGIEIQHLYTPIHFRNGLNLKSKKHEKLTQTEILWDIVLHIPVEPSIDEIKFNLIINQFTNFKESLTGIKNATS